MKKILIAIFIIMGLGTANAQQRAKVDVVCFPSDQFISTVRARAYKLIFQAYEKDMIFMVFVNAEGLWGWAAYSRADPSKTCLFGGGNFGQFVE